MALPTVAEIRAVLEGYCIDANVVSDAWISARLNNFVVPYVEGIARTSVSGVRTIIEYYNGNGTNLISLARRNIVTLIEVKYILGGDNYRVLNLANIELLKAEGFLKAKRNAVETWIMPVFPKGQKNLQITYTVGYEAADIPIDIIEAVKFITCEMILNFMEGRSGGGDIAIQNYSKSFGTRGKYNNIRNELHRMSNALLRKYMTGVI